MADESNIKLTVSFIDPDLDAEEKDEEARQLLAYLRELDEVETVERVIDPNRPEGSKAFGGFLPGWLMAEVSIENGKRVLGFLGDRLRGKPIELEVEGNGKKLKVAAYSLEELEAAVETASHFIG